MVIVREPFLFPFTRPPLSRAPSLSLMALLLLLLTSEPDHHAREREREKTEGRGTPAASHRRACATPPSGAALRHQTERERASEGESERQERGLTEGELSPATIAAQVPTTTSARWLSENRPRFGRIQLG